MGTVFRTFCQFGQHPNQVGRIGGQIVVALLSEGKDKLSLPFATFAETSKSRYRGRETKRLVARLPYLMVL